jgi:hypothetical protein
VNQNFTDIINGTSDGTKDFSISALTCAGNVSLNANVTLGNASGDDLTFTGSLASSIPIKTTYSYDIGTATVGLRKLYLGADDSSANSIFLEAGTPSSSYGLKFPDADGAAKDYLQTDASGQLSFVGGPALTAKTTTYTATTADKVITADTSGGAWTLTLYAASGNAGRTLIIKKISSDTTELTIDGNSAETIDGATTTKLYIQYDFIEIVCDGSNWLVLRDGRQPAVFRGRKSAAQSISNASETDIDMGSGWTTDIDTHGGVDTANDQYDVVVAGDYLIGGSVPWDSDSVQCAIQLRLYVGSTEIASFEEIMEASSGKTSATGGSTVYTLAAGDQIEWRVRKDGSASAINARGDINQRMNVFLQQIK